MDRSRRSIIWSRRADLEAGVDHIEQLFGVRATPGGQHPGVGTRNALVALGPARYLEIIGRILISRRPRSPAPLESTRWPRHDW